jgi:hypothetical protein
LLLLEEKTTVTICFNKIHTEKGRTRRPQRKKKSTAALTLPLLQQNPICKATEKRRQSTHRNTVLLAKKGRERELLA